MWFKSARKRRREFEESIMRGIEGEILTGRIAAGVTVIIDEWMNEPYTEGITERQDIERIALEIANYAVWKASGK